jgi:hypothetical protein
MELDKLDNSFDADNRVRCFNHTIQLSAKALVQPFNPGMGKEKSADDDDSGNGLAVVAPKLDDNNDVDADREDEEADGDDGIDEIEALSELDKEMLLEDTAVIREAVSKVRRGPHCPINTDCSDSCANFHLL